VGGYGEIPIQPAEFLYPTTINPAQVYSGVPTPGTTLGGPPVVVGAATCANLLADSPPTLLEQFEVYSLTVPAAAQLANFHAGLAAPINLSVQLILLINDRVAATFTATSAGSVNTAATTATAALMFTADLTNPIRVGARDRLGIRLGLISDTPGTSGQADIGVTTTTSNTLMGAEAKLFHNIVDLPASRRI
jgi:hypothetical protein